jgi:hypothetical protein
MMLCIFRTAGFQPAVRKNEQKLYVREPGAVLSRP